MARSFYDLEWNKHKRNPKYGSFRYRYVTHDDYGETGRKKLQEAGIPLEETTISLGGDRGEIAIDVNVTNQWIEILTDREIDDLLQ